MQRKNQKRLLAFFLGIAGLSLGLSVWAGNGETNKKSAELRVTQADLKHKYTLAFIGDSLTEGFYATQRNKCFLNLVQKAIGLEGVSALHVRGKAGALVKLLHDAGNLDYFLAAVDERVDAVVVELGTNDVGVTAFEEFEQNYQKLVSGIRRKNSRALILCLGVWRGDDGKKYDEAIQRSAQSVGGEFSSLSDLYKKIYNHAKPHIQTPWGESDAFHPSDEGHAKIADRIKIDLVIMQKQR